MKKLALVSVLLLSFVTLKANDGDKKVKFNVSGFVNFRVAYQLGGIVNDLDMITYDIPVPGDYASKNELDFDASTSRVNLEVITNTDFFGEVKAYVSTDFRGGDYNLNLREAYLEFSSLLFGQTFTNFCDLSASPTTVDFEGPNSYNPNFNLMVRYRKQLNDDIMLSAALEMPQISMTATDNLKEVPQILPDLTVFGEYIWGQSHVRASAVIRSLRYYNDDKDKYQSRCGWGVQLSGKMNLTKKLSTMYQGVYGQGITPYIQDITGSGLDLVEDPEDASKLQALPMYGFFVAMQYNFTDTFFSSGGYGLSGVRSKNDFDEISPDSYNFAQYIFVNMFCNLFDNCQLGFEYLRGTRRNMDKQSNHANRVQAMIQYNF